ncbi:hypothetical protein [uncultured Algibacter sp.]|uniref:hypothetical protein n=1 Tax=uncultured Algibacter sp. TaxID=298659 RepID=UPI002623BAAB|nr:hypothetical protein [uncultured Algibacter sp.]
MSKDLPQPQQSEEVDLGQLFKLTGSVFERLFRFIGGLFYKVFLAFVWAVFFVKKHIIKIVIAGVVGYGYGYYKQKKGLPVYKSTTVIKQNYNTGENLYRAIDYYNELIAEGDSVTLGSVLGIESSKAASLISLGVESVITDNEKLKSFDEYIKSIDSVLAKTVTFESFVSNSKDFQHPNQRIIIKAKEKDIFGSVINKTINKITETEYFSTEQKKDIDELNNLEKSILKSLDASRELQNVYKEVLVTAVNNRNESQTSITIENTEDKNKTKEFELYKNDVQLRRELVQIQRRKEDILKIIEVVSSQENQGTIDHSRLFLGKAVDSTKYYAIYLILITTVILLGFHFIKFLDKYKNQAL